LFFVDAFPVIRGTQGFSFFRRSVQLKIFVHADGLQLADSQSPFV